MKPNNKLQLLACYVYDCIAMVTNKLELLGITLKPRGKNLIIKVNDLDKDFSPFYSYCSASNTEEIQIRCIEYVDIPLDKKYLIYTIQFCHEIDDCGEEKKK